MSEEQETERTQEAEKGPESNPAETKAEQAQETRTKEEDGKEFAEFGDPKVEARFKRIYGHMKQYERSLEQAARDNAALAAKLEALETAHSKRETDSTLENLKQERKKAYEAQDFDRIAELDIHLARVLAERKESKPEPVAPSPAAQPGWEAEYEEWANEVDDDGNYVRPWALSKRHPLFEKSARITTEILNDPKFSGATIVEILPEIDARMSREVKPKSKRAAAPVLGSDDNVRPNKGLPKLTQEQIIVAKKMGFTPEKYAELIVKAYGERA